jgi:plasmid stabilization system protein ParE
MAYRVELAKTAEAELEELYLWVVDRAPSQGAAWFNGLERAILSLEQLPKRCRRRCAHSAWRAAKAGTG